MDRPAAAITADGAARHPAASAHVPSPRANIPQW